MNKNLLILTNVRSSSQYLINGIQSTLIGCKPPNYKVESTEILNIGVSEKLVPLSTRFQYFKQNFNRSPNDANEIVDHCIPITKMYLEKYNIFKLFKSTLIPMDHQYWNWLADPANKINVINLIRKNTLDRFVSCKIALKNHVWHTTQKVLNPTTINIDTNELLYFINQSQIEENWAATKFPNAYNMYYEDVTRDLKTSVLNMAKWFNELVGPFEAPNLKPTNPFRISEKVENFSEVKNALIGTPHEWMLY